MPGVETQLAPVVHDHDSPACHFTAGARRGRYGNQRRHGGADFGRAALNRGVGGQRAGMGRCNGHAFGAVDRRAAADRNQAVALVGVVDRHRRAHSRFVGVGGRLVKHCHGHSGQRAQRFLQDASRCDAGVGNDQGAPDAGFGAFLSQGAEDAEIDLDGGDVEDVGHAAL